MRDIVDRSGLRVAVVSLQRLGDVLTGARVTDGLSRRRDVASVDLVHWDQTEQAAGLMPGVDVCHPLPYGALRARGRVHPLAALHALGAVVELLERRYDLVVNLSSTRFACYIAPLLARDPTGIRGPFMDDDDGYCSTHPSGLHLNHWGVDPRINVFAHRDLYALAAGVRLLGLPTLPEDPSAQAQCDSSLDPRAPAPIALHIHASEPSKHWREQLGVHGWQGLIRRLRYEFNRDVVLLGAPSDAPELDHLAHLTGARVAAWSLRHTAELLRRCAGLVSVDTVTIHLAAAVGCKSIVLRQGSARGNAFLPGSQTMLLDAITAPATVEDVANVAAVHFFEETPIGHRLEAAARRIRLRRCDHESCGLLGAASPAWWPAPPEHRLDDMLAKTWRAAWHHSWSESERPAALLDQLYRHRSADPHRYARAFADPGPLGEWLRANDHAARPAA